MAEGCMEVAQGHSKYSCGSAGGRVPIQVYEYKMLNVRGCEMDMKEMSTKHFFSICFGTDTWKDHIIWMYNVIRGVWKVACPKYLAFIRYVELRELNQSHWLLTTDTVHVASPGPQRYEYEDGVDTRGGQHRTKDAPWPDHAARVRGKSTISHQHSKDVSHGRTEHLKCLVNEAYAVRTTSAWLNITFV